MNSCIWRLIVFAFVSFSVPAAGTAVETSDLAGTWRLQSIGGKSVPAAGNTPRFTIDGNTITGYDGCNNFGGPLDNPQMLISGQRACADGAIRLPIDLTDPKAHLESSALNGDTLAVPAIKDLPASTFIRE